MKITKACTLGLLLTLLGVRAAEAHSFGRTPWEDILYAAQNYNTCPTLPTDKLVAYMLSPTWWEVAGASSSLTPSPMALSRGDDNVNFYPPGQSGTSSAHRRAFWHPGIGFWQLDDVSNEGGSQMSVGKFNTWDAARKMADTMSINYCKSPTAYSVFRPWCACSSTGTCGAADRSQCESTFNKLYNPNGTPEHGIEYDFTTGRNGGAQVRTCRRTAQATSFVCVYVDPALAEGYTGDADGNPYYGWVSFPNATPPLAKPFYVFKEESGGVSYEWRYWMAADTGFGTDYAARRAYGSNSRNGLHWITNAGATSQGLCDVTASRGACGGSCTVPGTSTPLGASCTSEVPTVATNAATNITQQSASLNLSVDPRGSATSAWFEWDSDTNFCCSIPNPHQSVGASTGTVPFSVTLAGLTCDTTYYFRARAENTVGNATPGQTLSFRTDSCGGGGSDTQELVTNGGFESGYTGWITGGSFYIDSQPCPYSGSRYAFLAHADGTRGDNLYGTLDKIVSIPAAATAATFSFRYSIATNDPSSQPQDVMTVWVYNESGSTALKFLDSYSNLNSQNGCGTSYYTQKSFNVTEYKGQNIRLRFLATTDSRAGTPTVFRIDTVSVSATVPQSSAPDVATGAADLVTSSSARLNMTVNPNGANTTVWFDLEQGDASPDDDTEHISVGGGSQTESVSFSVFNLNCGTTYYFRANAENNRGSDQGSVRSFATLACSSGAPDANTNSAVNITKTAATLRASINPNGSTTDAWFEWGETTGLGQATSPLSVGSGTGSTNFSQPLSGLTCGTTYYFESHAQNAEGHDDGATLSFTTAQCDPSDLPVVTVSAIDESATEAGLTPGTFRISRTGSTSEQLNLYYTVTGTASYGVDYEEFSSPAIIPAGSASRDFTVQPKQDGDVEPDETIVLTLQAQSHYTVGSSGSATVTLTSDDGATEECSVSVMSPAGGETWMKTVPHQIKWSASPGCTSFAFLLVRDGFSDGFFGPVVQGSEFSWTPPAWLIPGSNIQIMVVGFDADGSGFSSTSNAFSLVNPPVLPAIVFQDDVEGDENIPYDSQGWGVVSPISHSPVHSRADSPGDYENDANRSLFTPWIDLTGRRSLLLTFWHRYDLANWDSINVWVQTSQGDWIYMRGVLGGHSDWQPVTIDLSQFVGQPYVQIAFQLVSDESLTADGWYIDDIKLYEPQPLDFYTVTPCRVVDTRQDSEPFYSGTLTIAGQCGIPLAAKAVSLNVTAANPTGLGEFTLFPSDQLKPQTSTINFAAGRNRGNNTIMGLSADGRLAAWSVGSGRADLILDVNGYFAESTNSAGKDIWTTSVYSYAGDNDLYPGGGLDDDNLRVGGWADEYYSLMEFDLSSLPNQASSARVEIFCYGTRGSATTPMYLDRITEFWDWRIQGTGRDRKRLWWADRPDAEAWRANPLPAPTVGQWYSIDITDLYNAWKSGTIPNYGVQLRPVFTDNRWSEFYSSNHTDPQFRPRLVVEP